MKLHDLLKSSSSYILVKYQRVSAVFKLDITVIAKRFQK